MLGNRWDMELNLPTLYVQNEGINNHHKFDVRYCTFIISFREFHSFTYQMFALSLQYGDVHFALPKIY